MNFKSTLIVGLALAATSSFGQGADDYNKGMAALKGHPAPKFSMTDTKGNTLTNASLRGKVIVLDFWATWCGPCKKASPVMQKLQSKYGSRGLIVIGAETLEHGAPAGAKAYAKEHGYTYTFTTNNDALTNSLGINAIPAFVVIDRQGNVAYTQTGVPTDLKDMLTAFEGAIKPLLK